MSNLHNIQVEQSVLSTLMSEDGSLNKLELKLKPEDFYAERHQTIFKIIEDLNLHGRSYDVMIVQNCLLSKGLLPSVGGEDYLMQLMSITNPTSLLNKHVEWLKKLVECRKVEAVGQQILELSKNTLIDDMYLKASDYIATLQSSDVNDSRYDLVTSSLRAFEINQIKSQHKKSGSALAFGVNTGLKSLDQIVGDIEPGHLCVIAGAPGGGKTTLAQMIAINAFKRNELPTLFLSCEMTHNELTTRLVSALARIPFSKIKNADLDSNDIESWHELTEKQFPNFKCNIVDKAGITISEIRMQINKTIAKYGSIGCLIVDYLQLIEVSNSMSRYDAVTNISINLKKIAKDFRIPVIALSQLTKDAIGRKLKMSDLRESGQIAQDADQIIMLYTQANYIVADVVKNRHGKSGETRLVPKFEYCQFSEIR